MTGGRPEAPPPEPAGAPDPTDPTTGPEAVEGPPGARTFSIEGRPAAGLYVVAWLLSLFGGLLVVIALFAASGDAAVVFLAVGLVALVLGFAAGAGYQVLARAARPADAYRGPAPLLVLAVVIALGTFVELVIGVSGVIDGQATVTFVLAVLIPFACYVVAIQVFAIRTGAISWPAIERLRPGPEIGRVGDWLVGVAAGIALVIPVLIGSALLTSVIGVTPNSALPRLTDGVDALAITLGAVVVAPLGEELFFRGFAYSAWRRDLGVASAVRRSAVLFAAVHILNVSVEPSETLASIGGQLLVQFLVILPAGLLLAFMYERRGLAASLGTHMAYNGGLLFLAAAAARAIGG